MWCAVVLIVMGLRPCVLQGADRSAAKPNVVFFYIDDLGWTDVGYMYDLLGRKERFYETPHIDQLAREGMVFFDAYANGPNCAPSRASLMSGQYTPRHGVYTVGDPRRGNHRYRKLEPVENTTVLGDEFVTIAEALRANGYRTASMGKWHLGPDPRQQGFDVNVAGCHWGSPRGGGYHSPLRYPNLRVPEEGVYLTDALTEKALQFITKNADRPFFLYLTHYAVHTPLQAKAALAAKYRGKQPAPYHRNPTYAAMIESVDQSVGAVLAKLDELGVAEDTLVVFFSDNGGFSGATGNHPLRGAKGMLYEGGIRVPLVIRWPEVTEPGAVCREPVIGVDLYPTLLEITGTRTADDYPLDGVSLVPLLRDAEARLSRPALFWHFPCYLQGRGDPHGGPFRTTPAGAIRMGDWKLIEWFETGRVELYRLRDDLGETRNLADRCPDKRNELHRALRQWREQIGAPVPKTPNPRYDPDAAARFGAQRTKPRKADRAADGRRRKGGKRPAEQ